MTLITLREINLSETARSCFTCLKFQGTSALPNNKKRFPYWLVFLWCYWESTWSGPIKFHCHMFHFHSLWNIDIWIYMKAWCLLVNWIAPSKNVFVIWDSFLKLTLSYYLSRDLHWALADTLFFQIPWKST